MKETPKFLFTLTRSELDDDWLPSKANETDTGFDVRAAFDEKGEITIEPGRFATISLGIKAHTPAGYWLQLNSRSSTFTKKNLVCLVGTIDESYEGEIKLACLNAGDKPITITHGERIAQLIPMERVAAKFDLVDEDDFRKLSAARFNTRGTGGFGSTGQ